MTSAERDVLILSLEPLVMMLARKRIAILPRVVQRDDIVSAAWLGAIEAVNRFDPSKKILLETYAKWRISGSIVDYLRSIDPVSRDDRRKLNANPDLAPPRTFSIHAVHDDGRIFDIDDPHSLDATRWVEAQLDVAKIVARAKGIKPRALRIITSRSRGEKMKTIGRRHGVNESRVSQICKSTLTKLRAAA